MMKNVRDLEPGDIVLFAGGDRVVAETKPGTVTSKYYPHRPYKVTWVRWAGQTDFYWKKTGWVTVRPR